MTSDRPYRSAMDHDDAVAELVAGAGTQFDPRVVAALLGHLAGSRPALSSRPG
jgi:HD-GYP domain-containing protein (c-di-GMP phosphodiesterase class II)